MTCWRHHSTLKLPFSHLKSVSWDVPDASVVVGIVKVNSRGLEMVCWVGRMRRLSGNTSAWHRNEGTHTQTNKQTNKAAYIYVTVISHVDTNSHTVTHCLLRNWYSSINSVRTQYTITQYATWHFGVIAPGEGRVFKSRVNNFFGYTFPYWTALGHLWQ